MQCSMLTKLIGLLTNVIGHDRASRLGARYGTALGYGVVVFSLLVLLDRGLGVLDLSAVALSDEVRGDLFGALIEICGLLLTVVLGVLAVVTSLGDDRDVVRVMKHELNNYDELVHRLVGPVFTIMLLAITSVACLMVGGTKAADPGWSILLGAAASAISDRGWLMLLPAASLSIGAGLLFQTSSIAQILAKVLLFKRRGPGPMSSVAATEARSEERRAQARAAKGDDTGARTSTLDPAPARS